jgi:murein DD-endopeptidase MepM/ murein hydrolase activator NlpD
MRVAFFATIVVATIGVTGAVAFGDKADLAPPTTTVPVEPTADEPVEQSPTTTSEFGTETEIEIALDDDGNIVPADD